MWHEFALIFSIVYVLYYITLFPSIPGGDAGEIAAEACQLGTAHPPGYPLFTLLNNVATKVPLPKINFNDGFVLEESNAAWRMNNLSAMLGAAAAALIGCTVSAILRITAPSQRPALFPAGAAGLLFALSPHVWEYSLGAEVFALNNFFCALIGFHVVKTYGAYVRAAADPSSTKCLSALRRLSIAGAFIAGLTMSNQHASLLLLAVAVPSVLLLLADSRLLDAVLFTKLSMAFFTGLSPYAYLAVAASRATPGSWGNMRTWSGLIRHVLRQEYGTFQLGANSHGVGGDWAQRIGLYLWHASQESAFSIFPLAALGLLALIRTRDRSSLTTTTSESSLRGMLFATHGCNVALFFGAAWLVYTGVWHCVLSNLPLHAPVPYGVHARFWMQPSVLMCVLAGVGIGYTFNWATARSGEGKNRGASGTIRKKGKLKGKGTSDSDASTHTPATSHATVTSSSSHRLLDWGLCGLLLSALIATRLHEQNRSWSGWAVHRYAEAVLDSMPANAVLLSHTDLDWNPVRFLQHCQAAREDVTHLSLQLMPYPWFAQQQAPLYPHIDFVPPFPGVSTDRYSDGNAKLIASFIQRNAKLLAAQRVNPPMAALVPQDEKMKDAPGGIFIDMQGLNEAEIMEGNQWRGVTLVPWGTHFRVMPPSSVKESVIYHAAALREVERFERTFGFAPDEHTFTLFHPSSWEFGALSMVLDAKYQVGLFVLTYALELARDVSVEALPVILDRLLVACSQLGDAVAAARTSLAFTRTHSYVLPGPAAIDRTKGQAPLTVNMDSLYKNNALAWMRLQHVLPVCLRFRPAVLQAAKAPDATALLNASGLMHAFNDAAAMELLDRARSAMRQFVDNVPDDPAIPTFIQAIKTVEQVIAAGPSQWHQEPGTSAVSKEGGGGKD